MDHISKKVCSIGILQIKCTTVRSRIQLGVVMVVVRLETGLVITNEDPRLAAQAKCSHEEGWVSCVRRSVVVG